MTWCFTGMRQRAVSLPGLPILSDDLMNDPDETTGDEFARMFTEAMIKPLDETS
jgi:hypothetical protein